MDEFNDLDKEIARLRQELVQGDDEWSKQFHFPGSDEYWRRRLTEEKDNWEKRLGVKDEERKVLEKKLDDQKSLIERYSEAVKELQYKMEHDGKLWEEKLKTKEQDLIFEKSRLEWEEKLKTEQIENKNLLEKINDLAEKINDAKNEHIKDRQQQSEEFVRERQTYDQRIKAYLDEIELLKKRSFELETMLDKKIEEYNKLSSESENRIKANEQLIAELTKDKNTLTQEKIQSIENSARQEKKYSDEIGSVKGMFKESSQAFIKNFYALMGPMIGLVKNIHSGDLKKENWGLVKDSLQRLENEVELYATKTDSEFTYNKFYTIGFIGMQEDEAFWRKTSQESSVKFKLLEKKNFIVDLVASKPQVVVVSKKYLGYAKKIKSRVPFMPVIIAGEMEKAKAEKLLSKGFNVITPPYSVKEAANYAGRIAAYSIAWPEFWHELKTENRYIKKIIYSFILLALLAAGILFKTGAITVNAPESIMYSLAYSQPTNIAYDGKYIWTCDWLGETIYQHDPADSMKLLRIYNFPGRHFTALTWAGGNLWTADPWEKKVYKHNTDDNLSIVNSYKAPNSAPSGIAVSKDNIWTCDAGTGKIYKHKMDENLSIEAEYRSPGLNPSGLYFDGEKIWSIDSDKNKIYCHNLDEDLSVDKVYVPGGYEQKGFNLSGITGSRTKLWICSEKMGKIAQYDKAHLRRVK